MNTDLHDCLALIRDGPLRTAFYSMELYYQIDVSYTSYQFYSRKFFLIISLIIHKHCMIIYYVWERPVCYVVIGHSHSQQPVPRSFPLFKRCEWLVVNCNVGKRALLMNYIFNTLYLI